MLHVHPAAAADKRQRRRSRRKSRCRVIQIKVPLPEDAVPLAAAVRESVEDLRPWMEWARADYSVDEARAWIDRSGLEREQGTAYEFLFTDGGGGILGACGLNRISTVDCLANLGYWIRT